MSNTRERDIVVSVVMPVFNVAPFVKLAVESVLNQTLRELELVVVDDGSTDGTIDALQSVRDHRLRIVRQDNAGSSAARNAGVQITKAPYIAFIDGDDLWVPKKLAMHMEFLKRHPEVDLSFSHSSIIDENGGSTGRFSRPVRGCISFRELLVENVISNGSAVVMRREAFNLAGHFDVNLPSAVDHDLWLRVALARPGNIHCIPQVLTFYRMRNGQITKDWQRMEKSWYILIEKMRRLAPSDVSAVEMLARSSLYRYLGYIAYESGQYAESASLLRTAIENGLFHLLRDRRMWLLAAALTARAVLPPETHLRLERLAREFRSRRRLPQKVYQHARPAEGAN